MADRSVKYLWCLVTGLAINAKTLYFFLPTVNEILFSTAADMCFCIISGLQ
jgi:hypothetical protein